MAGLPQWPGLPRASLPFRLPLSTKNHSENAYETHITNADNGFRLVAENVQIYVHSPITAIRQLAASLSVPFYPLELTYLGKFCNTLCGVKKKKNIFFLCKLINCHGILLQANKKHAKLSRSLGFCSQLPACESWSSPSHNVKSQICLEVLLGLI